MRARRIPLPWLSCLLLVASPPLADNKPNNQQERNDDQRVNKAQRMDQADTAPSAA